MQPLARLGAQVTGIDVVESNIAVAKEHASIDSSLQHLLSYRCSTLEDLVAATGDPPGGGGGGASVFDCVVASEVIEHVANVEDFTRHLCQAVKVERYHLIYDNSEYLLHLYEPVLLLIQDISA